MSQFTDQRDAATQDELWLLQHHPVFTFGQAGKAEHLLDAHDIPVVQSDRGGQITYHGPGQLIAYPLLSLRRLGIGVREFVSCLEQVVIDTLAEYHIDGRRRERAPGVYVNGAKIAALGLRVRRGYTFHGVSLNVAMDLTSFARINPCGFEGLVVTQVSDCINGSPPSIVQMSDSFSHHFCRLFDYVPAPH